MMKSKLKRKSDQTSCQVALEPYYDGQASSEPLSPLGEGVVSNGSLVGGRAADYSDCLNSENRVSVTNSVHHVDLKEGGIDVSITKSVDEGNTHADSHFSLESRVYPRVSRGFSSKDTAIRQRAQWLILTLLSNILTIFILILFSNTLEDNVELAFFIPLILASGGNIGMQTASSFIRVLGFDSVFVDNLTELELSTMSGTEALVGLLLGTGLGVFLWNIRKQRRRRG